MSFVRGVRRLASRIGLADPPERVAYKDELVRLMIIEVKHYKSEDPNDRINDPNTLIILKNKIKTMQDALYPQVYLSGALADLNRDKIIEEGRELIENKKQRLSDIIIAQRNKGNNNAVTPDVTNTSGEYDTSDHPTTSGEDDTPADPNTSDINSSGIGGRKSNKRRKSIKKRRKSINKRRKSNRRR